LSFIIPDRHHTQSNEDFIPYFIELTHAEGVRLELGNEVDARERVVLPALVAEDNGFVAFNPHHGPIAELDGVAHTGVEDGEGAVSPRHEVGGAGIHDPASGVNHLIFLSKLREDSLFDEMH
jgi:hypothetical protein